VSISGGLPQQFNRAIDLSALAAKKRHLKIQLVLAVALAAMLMKTPW